jgi:hypothetical protein
MKYKSLSRNHACIFQISAVQYSRMVSNAYDFAIDVFYMRTPQDYIVDAYV